MSINQLSSHFGQPEGVSTIEDCRPISIDVQTFREEPLLGIDFSGVGVIKRTNQDKRDAYIRKQMQETGHSAVHVIRSDTASNQYFEGKVGIFSLGCSDLIDSNASGTITMLQPTAAVFDEKTDTVIIGAADQIHRLDRNLGKIETFSSPWFARIHTIDIVPGTRQGLVTSASYDMFHIVDLDTGELISEFSIWDRFPCYNSDGQLVLRAGITPDFTITTENEDNILRAPADGLGLHHSRAPLSINSAIMEDNKILFTAFRTGTLYEYDLNSGGINPILTGMGSPHAISRIDNGYMVTDTIGENVIYLNNDLSVRSVLNFTNLGGKKEGLEGERWLQSATPMPDGLIAVVDSPRSSIHIVDPVNSLRRSIPFAQNWAMQFFLPLTN